MLVSFRTDSKFSHLEKKKMTKLTTVMAMSLALLANGVKHGPTMPPDPTEPVNINASVTHGPTMPPDPTEPVQLR